MVDENKNTEEKILTAAEEVFLQKGLDGARMQEIADRAGINKALLHYYYRTKDKLFDKIFKTAFSLIVPRVQKAIIEQTDLFKLIEVFIDSYLKLLNNNQFIPGFIIGELRRNPDRVVKLFSETIGDNKYQIFNRLQKLINDYVDRKIIRPINSRQLFVNILSMCIFPFVAKPVIEGVLLNDTEYTYKQFMKDRKQVIIDTIYNSLKI